MRKTLGIFLAALFLVSLSATAVSAACDSCNNWWGGSKDKCDFGCKDKCDKKCDRWGCRDKCDPCDCKDKRDCGCKKKCDCGCDEKKDDMSWLKDFGSWNKCGDGKCTWTNWL